MKNSTRARSAKKETYIVIGLYLLFFAWWYVTAYSFGNDPSKYNYILGFPEWFFYSCIVGYVGISTLLWICVRFFFTEIDFDEEAKNND